MSGEIMAETIPLILLIVVIVSGFGIYELESGDSYYSHTEYKGLAKSMNYNQALILKNSSSKAFQMLIKDDNCAYTLVKLDKNKLQVKCGMYYSYESVFVVQYWKNSK